MPRRRSPDRAWIRPCVERGIPKWELVAVIGGGKSTARFAAREEAERALRAATASLKRGTYHAPATWREAAEQYEAHRREAGDQAASLRTLTYQLNAVAETLGEDFDPLALSAEHARQHRDRRLEQGRSPKTVSNELEAVTSLQRWMLAKGWIKTPTWRDVTRPQGPGPRTRRELRPDEVGLFVRAAQRLGADPTLGGSHPGRRLADWQRWPAAVWILLHGLRTAEAMHLLVGDLDLVTGHVHVTDRKGARTKNESSERVVPILSASALECLRETFRDSPRDEAAFPCHSRGGIYSRTNWFADRCKVTCELAGIRHVSPHDLRHTVATAAVIAGADMHSVQSLLGHADARTTSRIYAHATSAERAFGAARVVGSYFDRLVEARASVKVVK